RRINGRDIDVERRVLLCDARPNVFDVRLFGGGEDCSLPVVGGGVSRSSAWTRRSSPDTAEIESGEVDIKRVGRSRAAIEHRNSRRMLRPSGRYGDEDGCGNKKRTMIYRKAIHVKPSSQESHAGFPLTRYLRAEREL